MMIACQTANDSSGCYDAPLLRVHSGLAKNIPAMIAASFGFGWRDW